jgi:hypothetical protein
LNNILAFELWHPTFYPTTDAQTLNIIYVYR